VLLRDVDHSNYSKSIASVFSVLDFEPGMGPSCLVTIDAFQCRMILLWRAAGHERSTRGR
jgi:hypothetical protein